MSSIICAIQIGTSHIMASAAECDEHNSLKVLAIESVQSDSAVRHGRIVGYQQAALHLKNLVQKLSNRTQVQITGAYIGFGGMTLHNESEHPTSDQLDVIDAVTLSTRSPQYLVADKRLRQSIRQAMERAGLQLLGLIALPNATSLLLSEQERQQGCVLVDMGASTTTVQVYIDGERRRLAVIPLGGDVVTMDLARRMHLSLPDAERLKAESNMDNPVLQCRYEEIIANIQHQIEASGIRTTQLVCGCILTGGAAVQRGLVDLIRTRLGVNHAEVRAFNDPSFLSSEAQPNLANLLALLRLCPLPVSQPTPLTGNTGSQTPADNGEATTDNNNNKNNNNPPAGEKKSGKKKSRLGIFIDDLFSSNEENP